ncbi:MAG: leucine/isoleucine/valine transporter permease subunit [Firmicutes bacterium ADurb.Bin182]|nr:MAG: leucine/isoleucine/valine transporter permease subunit [Firmicutes bacterium ADurb.Bin182]
MNILNIQKKLPLIVGLAVLLCALPFLVRFVAGNQYPLLIMCIILIYIIAVSGLDILFGYSGQISLGHAAFFTLGAYTSGLLNIYFNLPLYLTIPAGTILATLIGALLAYPASKLKFHFLSLATVAFGEITYYFLYKSPGGFTRDFKGINVISIGFLGEDYLKWYFFLLAFVVIVLLGKTSLIKSRTGRAFISIRENTHAADGMGINVRKNKIIAFAVSAFLTGLAGALYVHLIKYISPETSMQKQSVLFLTMLLFGGTASIMGTIMGVVCIEVLMEAIRPLQEYQMLFYGVLLLIVIVALPGGIYGGLKNVAQNIRKAALKRLGRNTDNQKKVEKGGEA